MPTRRVALIFAIGLVNLFSLTLRAQVCERLQNSSYTDRISYLANYPKQDFGQDCVAFAIQGLSYARNDSRAARVLIRYLTYSWEDPSCELVSGGRCMGNRYPAVNSLMGIGDVSRLVVLDAIKSNSSSQLARENALRIYYHFVREDPAEGIAALKWEADSIRDEGAKEHLVWAASSLASNWCLPFSKDKTRCEDALAGKLPFEETRNTYEIYGMVIPPELPGWRSDNYAIEKQALTYGWRKTAKEIHACMGPSPEDADELDSAISDFFARRHHPEQLQGKLRLPKKPYVLLDDAKSASYQDALNPNTRSPGDYLVMDTSFYGLGPLFSVSQVAFSKNRRLAIVYVQHETASTSGGNFHLLRRHANFWVEEPVPRCGWSLQKPVRDVKSSVTIPYNITVQDKSGAPLSGVSIQVQPWMGSSGQGKIGVSQDAIFTTNTKGSASLRLLPGPYDFVIAKPSFATLAWISMVQGGSSNSTYYATLQLESLTPVDVSQKAP